MVRGSRCAGCDERAAADVGRAARLELRFAARGGRTVLADAYAEPPFRVGRTFEQPDGGLHMIMASSAPGIFDGDAFSQSIIVESGACVRLTSQSALQAHPSTQANAARLRHRYVVEEGASLSCAWDPLIPFAASRLDQAFDVRLAAGARLRWSDAFMAGREARGERWKFALFAHELRITRAGEPVYLERFRIEPAAAGPPVRWCAGDASYFGSMVNVGWKNARAAADRVQADLPTRAGITGSADALADDVAVVRLMGSSGASFHAARRLIEPEARTGTGVS